MALRAVKGTSSDLTSRRRYLYDVFLSSGGEGPRRNFTDYLYRVLRNAGFYTYRDEDELKRGEDIKAGLQQAIQLSRTSVVVLSNGYASSRWCLDELVLILQRRKTNSDHVVIPVFYKISPSDVRKQSGSFGVAFARHEKNQSPEKVAGWREALYEVANLSGMDVPDQYEGRFIQELVGQIAYKLHRQLLSVEPKLTGSQSQVKDINLWSQDGSSNVDIFVMYGMSRIEKTTIAKHVYDLNFRSFEGSSFIENIKETAGRPNGLIQIQMQLLSDISDDGEVEIQNVSEGIIKIENAISSRRVLLVLDGVEDMDLLDAVLKMKDRFYPGSKILITTTNKSLLKANQVTDVHKVEPLDNESLELSKMVVQHSGGPPLAQEVIRDGKTMNEPRISIDIVLSTDIVPRYDSSQDDHDNEEKNANSAEWIFLVTSLCMEILSAVCDQASSPSRPRYALFSMLLAIAALITCIWERIYKGMGKRECDKLFDSDIELFVLVGGITQCVCSIIQYVYYIRHAENPIKVSLLPSIFLMCLIATRLSRKRMQTKSMRSVNKERRKLQV